MGRPKGSKNKPKIEKEVIADAKRNRVSPEEERKEEKVEVKNPAVQSKSGENPDDRLERLRQKSSRDEKRVYAKTAPPYDPEHQKLFEAPDGSILVGDIRQDRMYYRPMGIWINPMRRTLTIEEKAKRGIERAKEQLLKERSSHGR